MGSPPPVTLVSQRSCYLGGARPAAKGHVGSLCQGADPDTASEMAATFPRPVSAATRSEARFGEEGRPLVQDLLGETAGVECGVRRGHLGVPRLPSEHAAPPARAHIRHSHPTTRTRLGDPAFLEPWGEGVPLLLGGEGRSAGGGGEALGAPSGWRVLSDPRSPSGATA